jgi:hypothetical protein
MREIISVLKEITRELKGINKSLEVLAQDVKKKQITVNNTLIKG